MKSNSGSDANISQFTFQLLVILTFFFYLPLLSNAQSFDWERKINASARQLHDDFDFVGLQEVAEALNTHTYYSNKVRKAILYLGEEKITVTAYNPFILVGQSVLQMPVDTQFIKGELFVPIKYFVPILKKVILNSDANYSNDHTFADIINDVNITGIQVIEKANGTLIRVHTLKKFNDSSLSTRYSRRWLYLDILHGRINEKSFTSNIDRGLVKKVVPVQQKQMVQLSFQLKKDISGKYLNVTQRENEIWISIPTKDKLNTDIIEQIQADKEKWRIDKIVIDPGHGGRDPGTIGRSGVYEKDVVLAIAKKLKRLLQRKLKVQVFMTRENDTYISLKERTQLANKIQGKLFVSIHANWNRNSRVTGTSTYFLGLAKSEEALEIAQLENAVIKYENDQTEYAQYNNDESIILATMAQNDYIKESQDFAAIVQDL
ncbi:MAG: N-acetylmuramoyl-L-alanine amidase, partial [bacterium]